MAQPELDFFTKRGVVGKLEVTEGTDSLPLPNTDGLLLLDGSWGTEFDTVERPVDRPFFTNDPFSVVNKRGFIEGQFELFSPALPGTEPAECDVLLQTGGMVREYDAVNDETIYWPKSSAIPSGTFKFWQVDYKLSLLGARTALSALTMAIANRFTGTARVQGTYASVVKEVVPAIALYDDVPPVLTFDNSETWFTDVTGAGSPILLWGKELTLDFGTELATKEYTSKKVNGISGRAPTFTLRIARTDLTDINFIALRDAGNIITARIRHQEGGGLFSELGIRGQIEQVTPEDIDGDMGLNITGRCIDSSAATALKGDGFWIKFGDV